MSGSANREAPCRVSPAVSVELAKASVEHVAGWLGQVEDHGDARLVQASWRNLARLQASLRRLEARLSRNPPLTRPGPAPEGDRVQNLAPVQGSGAPAANLQGQAARGTATRPRPGKLRRTPRSDFRHLPRVNPSHRPRRFCPGWGGLFRVGYPAAQEYKGRHPRGEQPLDLVSVAHARRRRARSKPIAHTITSHSNK